MVLDWDEIYKSRGMYSGHGSRGTSAEKKAAAINHAISIHQPRSILDVGCGDQYIIKNVDLKKIEYVGIDSSQFVIDHLRKTKQQNVFCENFLELEVERSFDLVICFDVLIHLDDPVDYYQFIEKLKRIANKAILVSGYEDNTPLISRSRLIYFHESILQSFLRYDSKSLGVYNQTTILLVNILKNRTRRNTIWTYWETMKKHSRPEYLDLCEDTWHHHCSDDFEIIRVTPENLQKYVPDIIPEWHEIKCLAHKADYLRAILVYRYGGLWLDNDVVVLNNLTPVITHLQESGSDFIGCGRPGNRPSIGFFGGKAGSVLLEKYIQAMNNLIQSRNGDLKFKWTELGYNLLWPLTKNYSYHQYEFRICIPIHPSRFKIFFEYIKLDELSAADCDIRFDTLAVCLYNAMFPLWFKKLPKDVILKSPMVIAQIIRKSLGIPNWRDLNSNCYIFDQLIKIKDHNQLPDFLRRAGLNHRVCEISDEETPGPGQIIEKSRPEELVRIKTNFTAEDSKQLSAKISQSNQCQLESEISGSELSKYGERGKILRGDSCELADQFPDGHFDFIYINAGSSYVEFKRNLKDWYPKIRCGGILAGNGHLDGTNEPREYKVLNVVNEFIGENQIHCFVSVTQKSWLILKKSSLKSYSYCYWSVGLGDQNNLAMLRCLVKSARVAGVETDFHIWSDRDLAISECEVHEFSQRSKSIPGNMIKLEVLKSLQEFEYDYYIFLSADNYFTRKPTDELIHSNLQLANPIHAPVESRINEDTLLDRISRNTKWHGVSFEELIQIYDVRGLSGKGIYNLNNGYFIIKHDQLKKVYDTCWEGYDDVRNVKKTKSVSDAFAITYAMTKLTNPDGHQVKAKHINDLWAVDRGSFRNKLPDGKPFDFWTNWNGCKFTVNPAIVRAMKSWPQLIEYGNAIQADHV